MVDRVQSKLCVLVVGFVGVAMVACGGGPPEDPAGEATSVTEAPSTAAASEPVEVKLVDYAFEDLPASVEAGTSFTVVNESETELHEMVAFRLADDETRSVEELTTLSPEELETTLGQPVFVLLAAPNGPVIPAVGDGTLNELGRYAIFCFIPTGVDPQVYLDAAAEAEDGPPQVEGGPPHFVHGMFGEIIVP
jgi:hypothetical protein